MITGNTVGANCVIEVNNLTLPDLAPAAGPCTIVLNRERTYWVDYAVTTNWERRMHVEPVVETVVVHGTVTNVTTSVDPDSGAETATITTDQSLDKNKLLTPGALLCDGLVYQAYAHVFGDQLKIKIISPLEPTTDQTNRPRDNDPFVYYPGQKYEVFIEGFALAVDAGKGSAIANVAAHVLTEKHTRETIPFGEIQRVVD